MRTHRAYVKDFEGNTRIFTDVVSIKPDPTGRWIRVDKVGGVFHYLNAEAVQAIDCNPTETDA